jgi:hypothetical protein
MAVFLSPVGGVAAQFFTNTGAVLTGGKIYTYSAGTTTPAVTYTSSSGNVPQPNPIVLDAAGRVPSSGEIWLTDGISYKFVLKDSNDVLIATYDNITGINSNFVNFSNQQEIQTATAGQTVFTLTTTQYQPGTNSLSVFVDGVNQYGPGATYAYLETTSTSVTFVNGLHVGALVKFTTSAINGSSSGTASQTAFTGFKGQVGNVQNLADDDGSDWVGFIQDVTGAVAVSAQDKMRQVVSVKDFGAIGNGVADDTAALQAAFDWLGDGPFRELSFAGNSIYKVTSTLTMTSAWTARQGLVQGNKAQIVFYGSGSLFDLSACGNTAFYDLYLISNTSGIGTAIYARPGAGQYSGQSCFQGIQILDFDVGIYWGSATAGANGGFSTNFIDLDVAGCNIGLRLADGGNNALLFSGCRFASNQQGVVIDGSCYEVKFVGGVIEFNTVAGVVFGGTTEKFAISFDGIYFESGGTDFQFNAGTTNLINLTVENCYIFSTSATKTGVATVGAGVTATNTTFRNNFIYTSAGAFYGAVPTGTVLDNNYADFEKNVGGLGIIYRSPTKFFGLGPAGAGVQVTVTTNQYCAPNSTFNWIFYHNNNDGNYVFSGTVVVSQASDPKSVTQIALKSASGGTAAGGTIGWVSSGGLLQFQYTPPGGVSTLATSTLRLSAI